MQRPANRSLDFAALCGFVTLFPVFLAYHYMVASKWIAPVLGGLFGPASLLLALVALVYLATSFVRPPANVYPIEWAFLWFALYLLLWTAGATAMRLDTSYVEAAATESGATLSIWLACFFIGARAPFTGIGAKKLLMACGVLTLLILAHAMWARRSLVGPFLMFHGETGLGQTDSNASSTYQSIGRSILVIAIALAATRQKFSHQLAVLAAGIGALLATGSRGHLFTCILLLASLTGLMLLRRRNRIVGTAFLVVLLVAAEPLMSVLMETRAGEIFDLSESTSWQARQRAQSRAVDVVMQNPFLGDFGYHHSGTTGYAHNILSAWTQFGAVAFMAFLAMLLYALFLSAQRAVLRERCSPLWRLAFMMNMSALILALASESILASVFPALGWGCTVQALRDERASGNTFAIALQAVVRARLRPTAGLQE